MNILLPTDEKFVEQVAKAIARDRLHREAVELLKDALGMDLPESPALDRRFDVEFESLWVGDEEECVWNRENYTIDAITAINKINLMLLTMPM
jgi:hypothetical protein